MNSEKEKYVCFPLPLLTEVLKRTNATNDLLDFGIYKLGQSLDIPDERTAYRQLLYVAARKGKEKRYITPELYGVVTEFDDDISGTANECFMGEQFDPDFDLITEDFMEQVIDDWDAEIMEWYRTLQGLETLNMYSGDIAYLIEKIRPFYKQYASGQVPVSCGVDFLLKARDYVKTEYDRVRFCTYLAIRSLAKNGVALTTSLAIKWRSVGARNAAEYVSLQRDQIIKSIVEKWHTRRRYDRIMDDLIANGLILEMQCGRRIAVSASVLEPVKFAEAVANKVRAVNGKKNKAKSDQTKRQLQDLFAQQMKVP